MYMLPALITRQDRKQVIRAAAHLAKFYGWQPSELHKMTIREICIWLKEAERIKGAESQGE
jgi:hypothetical protein